jgi:hypothetical protein
MTPSCEQTEALDRASREYKRYRVPIQRCDGTWAVSDLYGAAFFHARGNTLIAVEPTGQPGRFAFVIAPRGDVFLADIEAWKSNAAIPVRDFIDGLYAAKQMLSSWGHNTKGANQ